MRYRLRTLLIVLALLPPVLAGAWWVVDSCRVRWSNWAIFIDQKPRGDGRGWATIHGPLGPGPEIPLNQDSYDSGWITEGPTTTNRP